MQCFYCKGDSHYMLNGEQVATEVEGAEAVPVTVEGVKACASLQGKAIKASTPSRGLNRDAPATKVVCGSCKGYHQTLGEVADCSADPRWAPRTRHGVIKEAARKAISGDDEVRLIWSGKKFRAVGIQGDIISLKTGGKEPKQVHVRDLALTTW